MLRPLWQYLQFKFFDPDGVLEDWTLRLERAYLWRVGELEDSIERAEKGSKEERFVGSISLAEEKKSLKEVKEMHKKYIRLWEKYRRSSKEERARINRDWTEWLFGREMTAGQLQILDKAASGSKEHLELLHGFAEAEKIGKEEIERRFEELLKAPLRSNTL